MKKIKFKIIDKKLHKIYNTMWLKNDKKLQYGK